MYLIQKQFSKFKFKKITNGDFSNKLFIGFIPKIFNVIRVINNGNNSINMTIARMRISQVFNSIPYY